MHSGLNQAVALELQADIRRRAAAAPADGGERLGRRAAQRVAAAFRWIAGGPTAPADRLARIPTRG